MRRTIAVTGLNATDNPGPGVAVARSLRADPSFEGRIVGLAYDSFDPGLYLPGLFDATCLIPYPSAGREAWMERLAYVHERFGVDLLIPNLDSELPALLDREADLRALGIDCFLPTRAQYELRSKARLTELVEHGVPVPASEVVTDPARLWTLHERFSYPVVVKGVFYGARVCHNAEEASLAFHKAVAEWGLPVIVQEHVRGDEVNVCAVGDGEGGLIGAVAMKKLMLTRDGKGWAGVTIRDPDLLALAARIVGALRWRGPCEIEVMRSPDGFHLMEINPRFPAWCDLCAGAGQNLPMAVARRAIGEPVGPLPPFEAGVAFVRVSLDQIVPISALEALVTVGEVDHPQPMQRLPLP